MPDLTVIAVATCLATTMYILGLESYVDMYSDKYSGYPSVHELKRVIDQYLSILWAIASMVATVYVLGYFIGLPRFGIALISSIAYVALAWCAGRPRRYKQLFDREVKQYSPLSDGEI